MKATKLPLAGLYLIEPQPFTDHRGLFFESFNARRFEELTGERSSLVQDNQSKSTINVVRGMHYQIDPHAQGKLVRVIAGAIYDVVVDVRRSSPTFGHWYGLELTAENRLQLWIPPGFAHGFQATAEGSEVLYKTSAFWNQAAERAIAWDDPALAIAWPAPDHAIVSEKDKVAPKLAEVVGPDLFP